MSEVMHIGRAWSGHAIEDECPCVKAPCGLVEDVALECTEHARSKCKTIRQAHGADNCPALDGRESREAGSMSEPRCACDVCGPDENTLAGQLAAFHRAAHDFGRVVLHEWRPLSVVMLAAVFVAVGAGLLWEAGA